MRGKAEKLNSIRKTLFRAVSGLLVVAAVSILRFVYSVGAGDYQNKVSRHNNAVDKALSINIASADVPAPESCGGGCMASCAGPSCASCSGCNSCGGY